MKYIITALVIAGILIIGFLLYNKQQTPPPRNVPTVVSVSNPWWHWPWWIGGRSHPTEYRVRRDFGPNHIPSHHRPGPVHGRVGAPGGHPHGPARR